MPDQTPEQRFAQLLLTDAAQPFVTYYDEATGERSELSRTSLANWVVKTHHLLTDELGLGVDDVALVALPAHWISVPVLLGCLTAGLAFTDDPAQADVAFVSERTSAAGVPDVYAVNSERAAFGFGDAPPDGTEDYVSAVRPQADAWAGVHMPATPADACLPGRTRGDVLVQAARRADDIGLAAGGRLLTTRKWATSADWAEALLAPLAVDGSLVVVRNAADESVVARRAEQERATARLT